MRSISQNLSGLSAVLIASPTERMLAALEKKVLTVDAILISAAVKKSGGLITRRRLMIVLDKVILVRNAILENGAIAKRAGLIKKISRFLTDEKTAVKQPYAPCVVLF